MTTTQQRRARLSIDVPREARRRIHIAAAKRDHWDNPKDAAYDKL